MEQTPRANATVLHLQSGRAAEGHELTTGLALRGLTNWRRGDVCPSRCPSARLAPKCPGSTGHQSLLRFLELQVFFRNGAHLFPSPPPGELIGYQERPPL